LSLDERCRKPIPVDQIAGKARHEARQFSVHPAPLLNLVERTRQLSAR